MNSYSNNALVNIDAVLDGQASQTAGPSFTVDTAAIQRRVDERAKTPFRTDSFKCHVPKGASNAAKDEKFKGSVGRWLKWNEQEGWSLVSNLVVGGREIAFDLGHVPMLDMDAYDVSGKFKYTGKTPKRVRYEFPKEGVKQDPEHRLDIKQAMRVWDVSIPT